MLKLDPSQLPSPIACPLAAYFTETTTAWSHRILLRLHVGEALLAFPGIIAVCDYLYRSRDSYLDERKASLDEVIVGTINTPAIGAWRGLIEQIWGNNSARELPPFLQELARSISTPSSELKKSYEQLCFQRNALMHPPQIFADSSKNQEICDTLDSAISVILRHYSFFSSYKLVGRTPLPHHGWWSLQGCSPSPLSENELDGPLTSKHTGSVYIFSPHSKEPLPLSPFLEMVFLKEKVTGHTRIGLAVYKRSNGKSLNYYVTGEPDTSKSLQRLLPIAKPAIKLLWETPRMPWPADEERELFLLINNKSYYPLHSLELQLGQISGHVEVNSETLPESSLPARGILKTHIGLHPTGAGAIHLGEGKLSYVFNGRPFTAKIPPLRLTCHSPEAPTFDFTLKQTKLPPLYSGVPVRLPISVSNQGNKVGLLKDGIIRASFTDDLGAIVFLHEESFSLTVEGHSTSQIMFNFTPEVAGSWQLSVLWEDSSSVSGPKELPLTTSLSVQWLYHPPEIIGRDRETARLKSLLNPITSPNSQLIRIRGEAGTGKSRLFDEVTRIAEGFGYSIMRGTCEQLLQVVPFSALKSCLSVVADGHKHNELGKRLIQPLRELLNKLEVGTPDIKDIRMGQVTATDLLNSYLKNNPLILMLDDVHWIDTASFEFLDYLLSHAELGPIKIVVTYRTEELRTRATETMRSLDRFLEEKGGHPIETKPLTSVQTAELISGMLGKLPVPKELIQAVFRESEGNPLLIVHMVDEIRSNGSLSLRKKRWELKAHAKKLKVRAGPAQTLLSRARHLSNEQYEILKDASVIGRKFPLPLLEALVQRPHDQLSAVVDIFERHSLVDIDHNNFSFTHGKIRDELYRKLPKLRKRDLHLRLAQILEERYAHRLHEYAGLIAKHLIAAGKRERAVYWMYVAATTQWMMQKEEEVRSQYDFVLSTLKSHQDPNSLYAAWTAKLRLAEYLGMMEAPKEAEAIFNELLNILKDEDDEAELFGEDASDGTSDNEQYRDVDEFPDDDVETEQSGVHQWLPEPPLMKEQIIGRCHLNLGKLAQDRNNSKVARAEFEACIEMLASEDPARGEAYLGMTWVKHDKGNLKDALTSSESAIQIFMASNQMRLLAKARIDQGRILLLLGRLNDAEQVIRKSLVISRKLNDMHSVAYAYNNLGEVFRFSGKWEKAEKAFETSIGRFRRCKQETKTIFPISNQAKLYFQVGNFEKAEITALEAFRLADSTNRHTAGVALTTLAQIYWIHDSSDSLRFVEQAIDKAKGLSAAIRARLLQARIWLSNGKVREAQAAARKIMKEFTREGDLFYQLLTGLLECQLNLQSPETAERLSTLRNPAENPFTWLRVRAHLLAALDRDILDDRIGCKKAIDAMVTEAQGCHNYLGELAAAVIKEGPNGSAAERILRMT